MSNIDVVFNRFVDLCLLVGIEGQQTAAQFLTDRKQVPKLLIVEQVDVAITFCTFISFIILVLDILENGLGSGGEVCAFEEFLHQADHRPTIAIEGGACN